jgi:hypothetical protein
MNCNPIDRLTSRGKNDIVEGDLEGLLKGENKRRTKSGRGLIWIIKGVIGEILFNISVCK